MDKGDITLVKNWEWKKWDVVCGRHFINGWHSDDPDNADYRPTLFMKGQACTPIVSSAPRSKRADRRRDRCHTVEVVEVGLMCLRNNRQCLFISQQQVVSVCLNEFSAAFDRTLC